MAASLSRKRKAVAKVLRVLSTSDLTGCFVECCRAFVLHAREFIAGGEHAGIISCVPIKGEHGKADAQVPESANYLLIPYVALAI